MVTMYLRGIGNYVATQARRKMGAVADETKAMDAST